MDPVATTRYGAVRGSQMEGITTFKGIPYAAPPCGQQRFRPAQPPAPWDGVRDALHFGPTAPQPGYVPPFDVLLPEPTIPGEDYLNLNIWTPDVGEGGLPVLVWIHGGAFLSRCCSRGELRRPVLRPRHGLVLPYPGHAHGGSPCGACTAGLYVRVRLAVAAVQQAVGRVPCAGAALCL